MKRFAVPMFIAVAFVLGLVVSSSGWQEDNRKQENVVVQPAVQKWEVKRLVVGTNDLQWRECQKLAGEGWELVGATDSYVYFKRPKQ